MKITNKIKNYWRRLNKEPIGIIGTMIAIPTFVGIVNYYANKEAYEIAQEGLSNTPIGMTADFLRTNLEVQVHAKTQRFITRKGELSTLLTTFTGTSPEGHGYTVELWDKVEDGKLGNSEGDVIVLKPWNNGYRKNPTDYNIWDIKLLGFSDQGFKFGIGHGEGNMSEGKLFGLVLDLKPYIPQKPF